MNLKLLRLYSGPEMAILADKFYPIIGLGQLNKAAGRKGIDKLVKFIIRIGNVSQDRDASFSLKSISKKLIHGNVISNIHALYDKWVSPNSKNRHIFSSAGLFF